MALKETAVVVHYKDVVVANQPDYFFDHQKNQFEVILPEQLQPRFTDLVVRNLEIKDRDDEQKSKEYLAIILDRDSIKAYTWPIFKIKDLDKSTEEDLYYPDGTPKPAFIDMAYEYYLKRTLREKGNNLAIMEGNVLDPTNGEITRRVIGGGLAFRGVDNEDEGWISKGVIHKDFRHEGLGRVLQLARVDNWFLINIDKNNLNTGVNIEPEASPLRHEAIRYVIQGLDIFHHLRHHKYTVTQMLLVRQLKSQLGALRDQGYPASVLQYDRDRYDAFVDQLPDLLPVRGYSKETMNIRRKIIQAGLKVFGQDLTPTEKNVLIAGGRILNAIPHSAHVHSHSMLTHTRRILIRRADWLPLQPENIQHHYLDWLSQQPPEIQERFYASIKV